MTESGPTPQTLPDVKYVDLPRTPFLPLRRKTNSQPVTSGGPSLDDSKSADSSPEPLPPPKVVDPKKQGSGSVPPASGGFLGDGPIDDSQPEERHGFFHPFSSSRNPNNNKIYITGDTLLWWLKPSDYPVLVTTGTPPTTAIGDSSTPLQMFTGLRMNFGYWFDPDHCLGMEQGFLYLGRETTRQSVRSNAAGVPAIGPAIINPFTGATFRVAAPGVSNGSATATFMSEMWGADSNVRKCLFADNCVTLDGLIGFRYLGLKEDFSLSTVSTVPRTGERLAIMDSFATQNHFYGPQIGFVSESRWRRFYLDSTFKLGMGVTQQTVHIEGEATDSLSPLVVHNGSLAQRSNIGDYNRNVFSVIPEINLTLGMNVTQRIRITAGYTFMYWTDVVRPGEQINGSRTNPGFEFRSTDFFAHGANVGLEYRY
jgi:hypothetical protein